MVRVVVDTNVIVSGSLKPGKPRKVWSAFKSGRCSFVLSSSMFREILSVLPRTKFHNLIGKEERKEIILYLELFAEFIDPAETVEICRDPEDNHILATASEAKADFIVTGDKDLLVLKSFRSIPIIKPKDFIIRLRKR